MKKMKKFLALGLSLMMIVGFSACDNKASEPASDTDSNQGTNQNASDDVTSDKAVDKVETLTLLMYTDWYKNGWSALETYINEHSEELGFKLEISKIQGGQQGDQVLQTKFATDDLPDIIQVYKPQWVEAYVNGLDKLVDLTGLDSVNEYDENVLNGTFVYNDKLYAMPIDSIVLSGVFYNKEVFKSAGVEIPTTWDEFLDICQKLKDDGVVPVYYSGKDAWSVQPPTISGILEDAAAAGKDSFGLMEDINTHKTTFSECSNFVNTIERTKDLIDLGFVNETYLSDTVDNAHQALAEGTCAMYINGTWCADNINQKYPDQVDDIGAFALPSPSGENYINMFTPYSLSLTTQCENIELGKKAIDFIASEKAQQIYADAQPGLYLNKNVTSIIPGATADLQNILKDGMAMTDWEEINQYSYGNLSEPLLNYYTGILKEAIDVTAAMDAETERNAKAKGDPNW